MKGVRRVATQPWMLSLRSPWSLPFLGEDRHRDLNRGHRPRPTGVEGEVNDRLLQLGFGQPILPRKTEMVRELLEAARSDEARHDHKASVTFGQLRAFRRPLVLASKMAGTPTSKLEIHVLLPCAPSSTYACRG